MFAQTQLYYELKTLDGVLSNPRDYSHSCDFALHEFAIQHGVNSILNHMQHVESAYEEATRFFEKDNPDAKYLCHLLDMYLRQMHNAMKVHCTQGYHAMIEECIAAPISHLREAGYEHLVTMGFFSGVSAMCFMAPDGGLLRSFDPMISTVEPAETLGAYTALEKEMFTNLYERLGIDGSWVRATELVTVLNLDGTNVSLLRGANSLDGDSYILRMIWESWRKEAGLMMKLMSFARQSRGYKPLPQCQDTLKPTCFSPAEERV